MESGTAPAPDVGGGRGLVDLVGPVEVVVAGVGGVLALPRALAVVAVLVAVVVVVVVVMVAVAVAVVVVAVVEVEVKEVVAQKGVRFLPGGAHPA